MATTPPLPSSPSQTPMIQLCLLISHPDLEAHARRVCECLSQRFGVFDVAVRSANVPVDELLSRKRSRAAPSRMEPTSSPSTLLALLGPPTPSTLALESEGVAPLLALPSSSDNGDPLSTALLLAKYCALASSEVRDRVERALEARRQSCLVLDAQIRTRSHAYATAIASCHDDGRAITGDGVALEGRMRGKVRDRYEEGVGATAAVNPKGAMPRRLALVTTDRQSGFDRMLAVVPFKGAVLNLTSAFWFEKTEHIVPNHLLAVPHPYVSIVRRCTPFPIEFVVRAYMTGSTSTSIWKNYQDGVRNYCGHDLPEGMVKNQKLPRTLLTPTTKEEDHDRPISLEEIVQQDFMSQSDLEACAKAALEVFALGQQVAAEHGLILVDTKYEFGTDDNGVIRLIDEVHTPDSSRYWLASTYESRIAEGMEPDNIDKEFLRLWFRDHCDPYNDAVLPEAPRDLVLELSRRYVALYEMITGKDFDFDVPGEAAIAEAIRCSLMQ